MKVVAEGADQVQGLQVGSDESKGWNNLWRQSGPAVQVASGATGVEVLGNGGISQQAPFAAANRFTDLLGPAGPGNDPVTGANGGIAAPVIAQADPTGVTGTAEPNATILVYEQQRPFDPTDPESTPEGFTFPATPATTQANGTGAWGLTFTTPLKDGQRVIASQIVGGRSSEFAAPEEVAPTPDPVARITSGPTGLVTTSSASFTFTSDTSPVTFECSLDGAAFAPCASPVSYSGLEAGGHQFRVRAVDLLNTAGPPASRAWTIELPGSTTTPGTKVPLGPGGSGTGANGVAASATLPLASVATLPSAKRCVSRRALRIRLKAPKGTRIAFARIEVPGRAPKTVRGKALSAPVNLRGLPKGRFTVRLRITLLDGRVVKGSRTFRTCAAKRR